MQGTLYPDLIESGGTDGTASVIKSHHNVGGLPEDMTLELDRAAPRPVQGRGAHARHRTRPARRDGVASAVPRSRASACGSSARSRPSVSPCCRTPTRSCVKSSQAAGLEREIWQSLRRAPADIRSVGVMGDERTYGTPDRHPGRHERRRDDRRLGAHSLRRARDDVASGSSTRSPASTGSSTTSRRSRPAPSSGNERTDVATRNLRTGSRDCVVADVDREASCDARTVNFYVRFATCSSYSVGCVRS